MYYIESKCADRIRCEEYCVKMVVNVNGSSGPTLREFGHCVVTWEIKNYRFAIWKENSKIESPIFSVRGPENLLTRWNLLLEHDSSDENTNSPPDVKLLPEFKDLKPEGSETKKVNFFFYLVRADSNRDVVWIDWKVRCLRMGQEQLVAVGGETYFDGKRRRGLHLGGVYDCVKELKSDEVLTYECQMLVYTRRFPKTFDNSVDTGLSNLSEDLKTLLEQNAFSDLVLKFGEKHMNVHKAILFSRCRRFVDMFEKDDSAVICLPVEEYEGMQKTISYIYSGDMTNIIDKPSIHVYDSACLLKLAELSRYYHPEEKSMSTKVEAQELSYVWHISNFSTSDVYCLSSPILANSGIDSSWQIHIYPRDVTGQGDNITISVENTEGRIWDDLCIQCTFLKEDEIQQPWVTLEKSSKEGESFTCSTFIKRETLMESLNDDLLIVGFKLVMCTGMTHTFIKDSADCKITYQDLKPLEKLSFDMSLLSQTDKHTDVVVRVGDEEIRAHKCILSARSRILSGLLKEMKENYLNISIIKSLSETKPDTFRLLVHYMYTSVLKSDDVNILIDVYKAAVNFAVNFLRETCSRVLRKKLTSKVVCDVLNLAHDNGDCLLKEAAISFIKLNMNDIFKLDSWKELKTRKPSLCEKLDPCKHQSEEKNGKDIKSGSKHEDEISRDLKNGVTVAPSQKSELGKVDENSKMVDTLNKIEASAEIAKKNEGCPDMSSDSQLGTKEGVASIRIRKASSEKTDADTESGPNLSDESKVIQSNQNVEGESNLEDDLKMTENDIKPGLSYSDDCQKERPKAADNDKSETGDCQNRNTGVSLQDVKNGGFQCPLKHESNSKLITKDQGNGKVAACSNEKGSSLGTEKGDSKDGTKERDESRKASPEETGNKGEADRKKNEDVTQSSAVEIPEKGKSDISLKNIDQSHSPSPPGQSSESQPIPEADEKSKIEGSQPIDQSSESSPKEPKSPETEEHLNGKKTACKEDTENGNVKEAKSETEASPDQACSPKK